MPFFSVIIPSYNRFNTLLRAIDSVLSQTFNDFEIIVVDDGSTDQTSTIPSIYTSVKYIKQANYGVSSARNNGIANSNSPYVAFLDSDDIWLPEKLEEQYKFIDINPGIHIHQTNEIWIRNGKRVNPMKKHEKPEGDIYLDSLSLCLISPSSVVIKRDLFNKYGHFDEHLPVCEDYDMWLRITSVEKVGLLRKNLIKKYGGHESQLSKKFWGMDRFRIYSIVKLLKNKELNLKTEYVLKAKETAISKCRVVINGARKRGKTEFVNKISDIINLLESDNYSNINSDFLLEKQDLHTSRIQ